MMFSLQQQNSYLATIFLFIITINDEKYVTQTIDSYFLLYTLSKFVSTYRGLCSLCLFSKYDTGRYSFSSL